MRNGFGRRSDDDERWEIARGVQVQPVDPALAGHETGRVVGVALAERHPSGWFLTARHHPDLPEPEVEHFRHFAAVRFFLLLKRGPQSGLWQRGEADGVFAAPLTVDDLGAGAVPDTVPAGWSGLG